MNLASLSRRSGLQFFRFFSVAKQSKPIRAYRSKPGGDDDTSVYSLLNQTKHEQIPVPKDIPTPANTTSSPLPPPSQPTPTPNKQSFIKTEFKPQLPKSMIRKLMPYVIALTLVLIYLRMKTTLYRTEHLYSLLESENRALKEEIDLLKNSQSSQ
eukprot:TRINITY_DN11779_c0_g1_i1.p1 TRINITY_DN11779_c0_g1~~TRINITY_DN11779_c0_g1_i1.p1  ORF type:complete len:155 (-),score=25.71 TRINITY_DN11779_c0_g1_i1:138-602(-)